MALLVSMLVMAEIFKDTHYGIDIVANNGDPVIVTAKGS